jgi:NitT/TauT family transport system permease protein
VIRALGALATSGELAKHLAASLARLAGGFALGMSAGIGFGLAIGLFTLVRSPGVAVVSALFPVPKIALLPLFIIWFGIGEGSKVATIAFGTFFPTVVATYGAVDNVDRSLVRMGRAFGLSSWSIVRKIVLPGALPGILSGLRIASSIGVVLLVAAEMIGADKGVGALVLSAGNLMQTDQLLAGVVLLSALGLSIAGAIGLIEKRLLAWR